MIDDGLRGTHVSWRYELVGGLAWWQRTVLAVCLAGCAIPLGYAARDVVRLHEGQRTETDGEVLCGAWGDPCRGAWTLPDGHKGHGAIDGTNPYDEEEDVLYIPILAGGDWAVTHPSALLRSALLDLAGSAVGAAVTLRITWTRSQRGLWKRASSGGSATPSATPS